MKKEHDIKNLALASDTLEYFPLPFRHFIANNIDLWISHTIYKSLMSIRGFGSLYPCFKTATNG